MCQVVLVGTLLGSVSVVIESGLGAPPRLLVIPAAEPIMSTKKSAANAETVRRSID